MPIEKNQCKYCRWSVYPIPDIRQSVGAGNRAMRCTHPEVNKIVFYACRRWEREPGSDDDLNLMMR